MAASEGHVEVVKILQAQTNLSVNAKNNDGRTILSLAAKNGHVNVIEYVLTCPNVDINSLDEDGWSALHFACVSGKREVMEMLLSRTSLPYLNKTQDVSIFLSYFLSFN